MKYTILQENASDCGFCVLKVLLANLHSDKHFLYLESIKSKPYSMLDLKKIAQKYSVNLNGYKLDDISHLNDFKFPMICQIKKPSGYHFVLLEKIFKNKYQIFDPAIGELAISEEEFVLGFTNHILVVDTYDSFKLPKEKIIINKYLSFSIIANFITGLSLFLSTIFISKGQNLIIFFFLMILLIAAIFTQTYFNSKYLDDTYQKYSLTYANLSKVSNYVKRNVNELTQIPLKIIVTILMFLIILESSLLGITNLLFLIYSIIIYLCYEKAFQKKANEVEFLESMQIDIFSVIKKGKSILYKKYAFLIAILFLNIGVSFFCMRMTGLVGIDYVIFITSVEFALFRIVIDLSKTCIGDLLYKSRQN